MTWKQAIAAWRALPAAERERLALEHSPEQVWQSMAFEREPVDLQLLRTRHARLMQRSRASPPPRVS